ncbi:uncharacterized [Tachysurus ichikawai]
MYICMPMHTPSNQLVSKGELDRACWSAMKGLADGPGTTFGLASTEWTGHKSSQDNRAVKASSARRLTRPSHPPVPASTEKSDTKGPGPRSTLNHLREEQKAAVVLHSLRFLITS